MRNRALSPERLLLPLNIILGAALIIGGLMVARNALTLALSPAEKRYQVSQRQAPLEEARKALDHYAPLLSNNVFGFPAGKLRPLSAVASRRDKTDKTAPAEIGIILRGTVASADGTGHAIVEVESGDQSVYATGEHIEGAGILRRVARTMIIVGPAGREQEVTMAEIIRHAGHSIPRNRASAKRSSPADFARKTAERTYVVDQGAVRALLLNPEQIMTDARLMPNVADGRREGFVISEIKHGGIFQSLGIKNGDVLIRVNEFTLSDPQTALQAFTALKGMNRIELDIIRNGTKMTLTYVIR